MRIRLTRLFVPTFLLCSVAWGSSRAAAQEEAPPKNGDLHLLVELFATDQQSLFRTYRVAASPARQQRMHEFYVEWRNTLKKVEFDTLNQDGRIDYITLDNYLTHAQRQLTLAQQQFAEMEPLIPFAKTIFELDDSRHRMDIPKGMEDAALLAGLVKLIAKTKLADEAGLGENAREINPALAPIRAKKTVARRAARTVETLREALKNWYGYYAGYDPAFTWWVREPYQEADKALEVYDVFLNEKLVGIKADDKTTIIGDPVGREALLVELADSMIPYTPEELIALGKNEMAWCTKEMLRASHELGYGDDWHQALEHVKDMHVEPGQQPELIRALAREAIAYVEKNNLVTVPPLAKETWRMEMMSPERQLINPFFTGGEVISVSYPTDTMTFEQRMMSMRGNNIPFARATVFHELIPGHHLQLFMSERYRSYRRIFQTPFWVEGNAFYWEMVLWDMGFPQTPEERIGMLFWRMHRCARVIFSLSFHLGWMTPEQCVEFLVDKVGHERDNATAEVRRSFDGSYSPLYQAAYMLGALQFRALRKETVTAGRMTNREFHDAILQENGIPVEMIRAKLLKQPLTRNFEPAWKFYGPIPATP